MPEVKKTSKSRKDNKNINLDELGLGMGNKPPQAVDFEEAVLGALLMNRVAWTKRWRNCLRAASMILATG